MALSKKKAAADSGKAEAQGGFRPMLLAAGFGLLWFVASPSGGFEEETSGIVVAVLTAARLAVDVVGGWVVVVMLRLAFVGGRYALAWSRTRTEGEMS